MIVKRYSSIDQLRFIAALSVAISHLIITNNGFDLNLEIISSISVEVFFIISGFVLAPQIIRIVENNKCLSKIDQNKGPKIFRTINKLPTYISNGYELLRLYLLKPLDSKDFQPSSR